MNSLKRNSENDLKIIVDTNIIFSALINPDGNETKLFLLAHDGKLEIIICDYVLDEAKAVLERKDINPNLLLDFLDTFHNIQIVDIGELKDDEIRKAIDVVNDEKDRPIFIFARRLMYKNKNVYLVTGDKDLRTDIVKKELKERSMTTTEFLTKLSEKVYFSSKTALRLASRGKGASTAEVRKGGGKR